ncbi:MAG: substrate-binding domain-containing protein [Pseudolabrys sp.]
MSKIGAFSLCATIAVFCTVVAAPGWADTKLKIIATPNMRPVLPDLTAGYERSNGPKLSIDYVSPAQINSQVEPGANVDVVISIKAMVDALGKEGKLTDVTVIARSPIGVAVQSGQPKPDISSPAAFKAALLNAKSIVHSDGGPSGVITARLIKSMGIEEQVKSKLRLVPAGGQALPAAIASGEAELGIDQLTVLEDKPGIEIVGTLPKEFAADILMSAGIPQSAPDAAAASQFIKFLKSSDAAVVLKAHGMLPN